MLRKILLGLDIICLVISIAIGIDYSCYVANIKYVNDTKTVILDDIITLNCEDKNININEENIKESYTKEFEVSNLTDKDTNFNIYLDNIVNSYDKDLVYELYNEEKLIVSRSVAPTNQKAYIKLNIELKAAESKKYKLVFYINNKDGKNDDYYKDKKFEAYIQINSLKINSEIKTATNYLIENNEIKNDGDSNDGLYKITDNDKTIYNYKGNVHNNYVSFNDELWRIVRINEDGSIRIIKNSNIVESIKFNDDSKSDTSSNYLTSNIKNRLNGYYNDVLKKYESMITMQNYCLNIDVVRNDNYKIAETVKNTSEYNPVVICNDSNKNVVGLLSYNDIIFAGLNYNSQLDNYLLDTDSVNTWLSTKAGVNNYNNDHYVWYLDKNSIKDTSVTSENSIRPVINLKATLNMSGNGTIEEPYIFSE